MRARKTERPTATDAESHTTARPTRGIYIAWVNYQRRAESMQAYFGYDLYYIASTGASPIRTFVSYFARAAAMIRIIRKERPDVVWLQLPPTFLLHLAILLRFVTRQNFAIIADCHNAALRLPWSGLPLTARLLNRANLVLVHNRDVAPAARRSGVRDPYVLADCVPALFADDVESVLDDRPTIVMPCSFHADEPIEAVLQAAREFQSATFVITGDHHRMKNRTLREQASRNVVFAGFLPLPEFDRLLLRASAVLCLTTHEGVQLSVASEAIGAGRPMIISDTKILRSLFGEAGIFVDNSPASIVSGCRTVLGREREYAAAAQRMRTQRMEQWFSEAEPVRRRLAARPHA